MVGRAFINFVGNYLFVSPSSTDYDQMKIYDTVQRVREKGCQ